MKNVKLNYSNLTPLPNDFLVEQSILNILLTNPNLIQTTIPNLAVNCFYSPTNKLIYLSIVELIEKNSSVSLNLLLSYLHDEGRLKEIGGVESIVKILNHYENFSHLDDYLKILNQKYLRRLLIEFGKEIIALGYTNSVTLEEIISKIENYLSNLVQQKTIKNLYTSSEILDDIFEKIKKELNNEESNGLKTSFNDLDSILQGLQKSDLIIIAGRPSMGKTAFSLNLGKKVIEKYNLPLIIFSLEMSRQQIIYRFISAESQINSNRLKTNKMTSLEWKKLSQAMVTLSKLPIFIDDNPNLTLSDIRLKLRKVFIEKKKNGLVIIDYLQLMKLSDKMENRVQEISYLTRNLKILAKEFEIPILVLSQLSRSVESRLNKRPMLSDLRESGCLVKINSVPKSKSWNKVEIISNKVIDFDFKGVKPTFLLSFENGIKICLTSNHKILSKKGWIKILQIEKSTELYCLISSNHTKTNFDFYKVEKIEYIGLNAVYDKTIPIYHNYIDQNFILHNSIEQDADVVILLYREDYYNESKTLNNVTEFIVSKHRNGPVGTARLIFNPEYTTFENLKE